MYASSWFLTLFLTTFPLPVATRVFDIFMYEVRTPNTLSSPRYPTWATSPSQAPDRGRPRARGGLRPAPGTAVPLPPSQGLEIVFRVGLALLQVNQTELMQLDMEGMSQVGRRGRVGGIPSHWGHKGKWGPPERWGATGQGLQRPKVFLASCPFAAASVPRGLLGGPRQAPRSRQNGLTEGLGLGQAVGSSPPLPDLPLRALGPPKSNVTNRNTSQTTGSWVWFRSQQPGQARAPEG